MVLGKLGLYRTHLFFGFVSFCFRYIEQNHPIFPQKKSLFFLKKNQINHKAMIINDLFKHFFWQKILEKGIVISGVAFYAKK